MIPLFGNFLLRINRQTHLIRRNLNHLIQVLLWFHSWEKTNKSSIWDPWKTLEAHFPSIDFFHPKHWWSLFHIITKNLFHRSPSDLSQDKTPFTEVKNYIHCFNNPLNKEIKKTQEEPLVVLLHLLSMIQKSAKETYEPDSSKPPKRKNIILNDPAFSNSHVMPPTLKPSPNLDSHQHDEPLTPQMSTEKNTIQISIDFAFFCSNTI